jgi:hypothetical protein
MKVHNQILFVLLATTIFACGKKTSSEIIPKNEDTIKPQIDTIVKVVDMGDHIFNKWLGATIGSTSPLDTSEISKAKFKSFENYEKVNGMVKELKYFEVENIKPEITIKKEMIMLEYENSGFERFICTPEMVIISYHAYAGDDGGSHVIDLITNEVKSSDYTIFEVNENIAKICSDGYDDDGHYWHYGTLDLATDSITWDKLEH